MFVMPHVMCGYWREQRKDFVGLVVIGKQVATKNRVTKFRLVFKSSVGPVDKFDWKTKLLVDFQGTS